jgi:hypothetical protein
VAAHAGSRPVAPGALLVLFSFHAGVAAVLLLDPHFRWVAEVGGEFGGLWG